VKMFLLSFVKSLVILSVILSYFLINKFLGKKKGFASVVRILLLLIIGFVFMKLFSSSLLLFN
jgi:hypothetical protein